VSDAAVVITVLAKLRVSPHRDRDVTT